jgi:hypothetical protein
VIIFIEVPFCLSVFPCVDRARRPNLCYLGFSPSELAARVVKVRRRAAGVPDAGRPGTDGPLRVKSSSPPHLPVGNTSIGTAATPTPLCVLRAVRPVFPLPSFTSSWRMAASSGGRTMRCGNQGCSSLPASSHYATRLDSVVICTGHGRRSRRDNVIVDGRHDSPGTPAPVDCRGFHVVAASWVGWTLDRLGNGKDDDRGSCTTE